MKKKEFDVSSGFIKHNNYQYVDHKDGEYAVIRAELNEDAMNPYGFAHGGFIFGLGDTVMGLLAITTGRKCVTISSSINYLKPAVGKCLTAKSEIIKNGKTICYLRANIYNDKEELVATMDGNYYYID